jgi:hypothetical protein
MAIVRTIGGSFTMMEVEMPDPLCTHTIHTMDLVWVTIITNELLLLKLIFDL